VWLRDMRSGRVVARRLVWTGRLWLNKVNCNARLCRNKNRQSTQEVSVIYACRAIVGRDTPAILIVTGIPGGWSLVWNERFIIVWFSPSVRGSHVFGGLAWSTNWMGIRWLVNSLKWLAFQWYTERYRESGWRGWYIPWGRAFLSRASMVS